MIIHESHTMIGTGESSYCSKCAGGPGGARLDLSKPCAPATRKKVSPSTPIQKAPPNRKTAVSIGANQPARSFDRTPGTPGCTLPPAPTGVHEHVTSTTNPWKLPPGSSDAQSDFFKPTKRPPAPPQKFTEVQSLRLISRALEITLSLINETTSAQQAFKVLSIEIDRELKRKEKDNG